jgi:hypothetical protein
MKRILVALIAAAALPIVAAHGQSMNMPMNMPMDMQHGAAGAPAAEDHPPGLGEIMLFQQMRHIKVWFAGRAGNWALADHEVDELKEGFDDVDKLLGGDTVKNAVGDGMSALEKAVDAKDRAAFARAFDTLTAGCNG